MNESSKPHVEKLPTIKEDKTLETDNKDSSGKRSFDFANILDEVKSIDEDSQIKRRRRSYAVTSYAEAIEKEPTKQTSFAEKVTKSTVMQK